MEFFQLAVIICSLYPFFGYGYLIYYSIDHFVRVMNIIILIGYLFTSIFQIITIAIYDRIKRNENIKWLNLYKTSYLIQAFISYGVFSEFLLMINFGDLMQTKSSQIQFILNIIVAEIVYIVIAIHTVQIYRFSSRFKASIKVFISVILIHVDFLILVEQLYFLQFLTQQPLLIVSIGITLYIIYEIFKQEFSVVGDNKNLHQFYYLIIGASLLVNLYELSYQLNNYLMISSIFNFIQLINLSDYGMQQNKFYIDEPLIQEQNILFLNKSQCDDCAIQFTLDDKISYFTACSHIRHYLCQNDLNCQMLKCTDQYRNQIVGVCYKVNMQMVNYKFQNQFQIKKQFFLILTIIIICQLSGIALILKQQFETIMWIQIVWVVPQLLGLFGKMFLFLKYNFQRQPLFIQFLFDGVLITLFLVSIYFKYVILQEPEVNAFISLIKLLIMDSLLSFFQLDQQVFNQHVPKINEYMMNFLLHSNINNVIIYYLVFQNMLKNQYYRIYLFTQTLFYVIISLTILLFDLTNFKCKSLPTALRIIKYISQVALVIFTIINIQDTQLKQKLVIYSIYNLLLILRLQFYDKIYCQTDYFDKNQCINMALYAYRTFQQQDAQCKKCNQQNKNNQELIYFVNCQHSYHLTCISYNQKEKSYNCPLCDEILRFQDTQNQFLHLKQL